MSIREQLEGLKSAIQMIQTSINEIINELVSKLVDKLIEHEQHSPDYSSSDSDLEELVPDSPESDRYISNDDLPSPPPLIAYRHNAIQLPDQIDDTPPPLRSYIKQQYDRMP